MKILLSLAVLLCSALAAKMTEVSGFKTADQVLTDVQSDMKNIYTLVFFKRDDKNFDLTKSNKKFLDAMRKSANKLATQVQADGVEHVYFAAVDMSVPENKVLWEKFGLKETSCDKYPAGAVMKGAKGQQFEGPALVSIFERNIKELGEISDGDADADADAAAADGEANPDEAPDRR